MIEETRSALEKLELDYREGNSYFSMSCPFAKKTHLKGTDDSPSFVIYPEKGFVKCFSCGIYFELFEFFSEYQGYINKNFDFDFLELYRPLSRSVKKSENIELADHLFENYKKNSIEIRDYLDSRGIYMEHLPFDLYFDHVNKNVVMPVKNENNKIVGATCRNTKEYGQKTLHTFGISTELALLGLEKRDKDAIIIVEGMTDVLNAYDNLYQTGLSYNVYATFTASLSEWQAEKILDMDKPIFLAQDLDKAGLRARKKSKWLLKEGIVSEVFWKDVNIDMGNMNVRMFEKLFQ